MFTVPDIQNAIVQDRDSKGKWGWLNRDAEATDYRKTLLPRISQGHFPGFIVEAEGIRNYR